jgi:succinate dehydrogenase (ubiquinone) flavoprotein subunit
MTQDDWLENYGMPFSRSSEGMIYRRVFSGQSLNYGKRTQAYRTTCAADRTGQAMLRGQSLNEVVQFFLRWFVLDLMMVDGKCVGITAMNIGDGTCHRMFARNTVLATGGTFFPSRHSCPSSDLGYRSEDAKLGRE